MRSVNSLHPLINALRPAAILFAMMILGAALVTYLAITQMRVLIKAHESQDRRTSEALGLVRNLRGDLENAQKSLGAFQSLQGKGTMMPFAKQVSLDQVDQLMQRGWVTPKSYALAAQAQLVGPLFAGLSQHVAYRHSLSFEVTVPHELRLLALIDGLVSQSGGGLHTVEMCELALPSAEQKVKEGTQRALSARCTMNWYRFELKSGDATTSPSTAPLSGTATKAQVPGSLSLQANLGVRQ